MRFTILFILHAEAPKVIILEYNSYPLQTRQQIRSSGVSERGYSGQHVAFQIFQAGSTAG